MTEYLSWRSALTLQTVFASVEQPAHPILWGGGVLYLSTLKAEQGRVAVMYRRGDKFVCLTPPPFNLRSKFSEYGGKPYWVEGEVLYFVNQSDQCLYQQKLLQADLLLQTSLRRPERLSPPPDDSELLMYADLVRVAPQTLLAIVERERLGQADDCENKSCIALLNLQKPEAGVTTLLEGADFYSNLCVDAERRQLAWVQWDHPNMPWDETQLWLAEYQFTDNGISFNKQRRVNLADSASVCQLMFANNGRLFFSADFSGHAGDSPQNYWNLYALHPDDKAGTVTQVTDGRREFGYPHWQYGDARIVMLDATNVLAFASDAHGDLPMRIDQDTLLVQPLERADFGYQNLSADGKGSAAAIMLSSQASPCLAVLDIGKNHFRPLVEYAMPLTHADISLAEHFEFPTRDGAVAYGYYYAPRNAAYPEAGQSAELPPLIVMVHGGPTARAYGFFDIQKQFWTHRGFAVFDVNHRGSNGYGRAYRDALYGGWGETDTGDIVDGIDYLVQHGKAAVDSVCIRGKSAGGYAVLRALTEYPKTFRAGACYYGIGNLATLAETTHKFEKHYADRMIGEAYDAITALRSESLFQQRSPINKIGKLRSAMIVFQGLQDKVVPPAVAHEIIDALKKLGLEYCYVEYADEGHGFRQVANNIDAW
ncbi:MAG: S9 family peptidase, partial [Gammaproteobacteria bacterium]|nr:S9 family peptidase [Gammaproteobacteria bacterium]